MGAACDLVFGGGGIFVVLFHFVCDLSSPIATMLLCMISTVF